MQFFRKKEKKEKEWKRKNPRMYSGVPKRANEGKRSKFSRFLFWVLLLGFFGVCVYMLLFSPFLEVDAVSVRGSQSISSEEIVGRVSEAISGKYYNIFSRRNFFLLSKNQINEKLKNEFNRLEVSSIEKKFPRAVLVEVKERQPEMAWCSGGVCYLVDKDGFVYVGANSTDQDLSKDRFLIMIDDNAQPVDIKKTTIDPAFIQYLKQIDAVLVDDLGLQIDGNYHTPAISSREASVRIKEGEGWTLKMSEAVSSDETKKIIQTIFEKELDTEKRNNLDYLDLSVKGKVYYKMK